jgi:hypothetical protein
MLSTNKSLALALEATAKQASVPAVRAKIREQRWIIQDLCRRDALHSYYRLIIIGQVRRATRFQWAAVVRAAQAQVAAGRAIQVTVSGSSRVAAPLRLSLIFSGRSIPGLVIHRFDRLLSRVLPP